METLEKYADTREREIPAPASSFLGRRRGDVVLLAWKFARERGDMDVADQLMIEYECIIDSVSPQVIVERRRQTGNMHSALRGLWAWFSQG
jgi:hypothetical protein